MPEPTIYYICTIPPKTGGEWVNLQSVASLNQSGMQAVALVNADAPDDTAVEERGLRIERLAPHRQFTHHDIVVIPEYYRNAFAHFATQPCKRVIHTQGPFLSFRGFDSIDAMNSSGLLAGIACSHFGKDLMQRMGSTLPWQVVTPFIHPMFHASARPKKLQIAYMPHKRPQEAPVIQALFRHLYPQYRDLAWIPITGLSRAACAHIMAESAVFASLSKLEGLGLPPLEAMASGSLVCGFTGHGGQDYATPDNGLWVAEGDHTGFAHALATALQRAASNDAEAHAQRNAAAHTAAQYTQARFDQELRQAWQHIVSQSHD